MGAEHGNPICFEQTFPSANAYAFAQTSQSMTGSTLLMMMSAFADRELMLHAYETAVQEKYRFFSYGDCMLIL